MAGELGDRRPQSGSLRAGWPRSGRLPALKMNPVPTPHATVAALYGRSHPKERKVERTKGPSQRSAGAPRRCRGQVPGVALSWPQLDLSAAVQIQAFRSQPTSLG